MVPVLPLVMVPVLKMPSAVSNIVMSPVLVMVPSLMMPSPAVGFDIVMVPELLMVLPDSLEMPMLLRAEF